MDALKKVLGLNHVRDTDVCNDDFHSSSTMTTTSIRSKDDSNLTQESIDTAPTFTSEENNETWYDTNEEYDSWYDAMETMDNYQEWVDPPMTDKLGCQFIIFMLCKCICFMLLCTFQAKVTTCETIVCAIKTLAKAVISTPIAIYK